MKLVAVLVALGIAGTLAAVATTVRATPGSPLTVVTARGELDGELKTNTRFDNGASVKIKTEGPIEVITQRVEAPPGSTFGWHTHPGPSVVVILQGTLTLYHAEHCQDGIAYGVGSSFSTTDNVHLAKNNGTETVVAFATYFAPKTTPPVPVRIDAPSPGPECPL